MTEGPALKHLAVIMTLATVYLSGCATLDPDPAFQEVRRDVAERTGRAVQWNRGTEEDAAVARRMRAMLADEVTLDEAVQIALLNNPRLQGTYEELGIAQANLVQAGLLKNPVFSAEGKFLDSVPGTQAVVEMSVLQDFMDILLIPLRKRLARAELEATQAEVVASVLELATRVRVAFVSLQASCNDLVLQRQILQATDASYDAARRLHRAGNINDLALADERVSHEQSKLAVADAETAVLEITEELNVLMGLWGDDTRWSPSEQLPEVPEEEMDLTDLERRAVAASLDLAVLRQAMQAVSARTGMEAANLLFPQLEGGAAAEYDGPEGQWQIGPAFTVGLPIFDWGQARTAAGRHRLRRLWHEYTALAIEIRSMTRTARYRLVNARRQSIYLREVLLPLAKQITAETQLQYNAMQLGVFQLLEAKRREIDVQRQHVRTRRDYWIARTELEQILEGRLVRSTNPVPSMRANRGMEDEFRFSGER